MRRVTLVIVMGAEVKDEVEALGLREATQQAMEASVAAEFDRLGVDPGEEGAPRVLGCWVALS